MSHIQIPLSASLEMLQHECLYCMCIATELLHQRIDNYSGIATSNHIYPIQHGITEELYMHLAFIANESILASIKLLLLQTQNK